VQLAWFDDQSSVALCPTVMVVGATVSDAVGAGGLSDPPPPQPASTLPSAENAISPDLFAAIAVLVFMT
jgi:hypothetical protein